jgi:hypothetical protein
LVISTPILLAPVRYGSGCGFPFVTSLAVMSLGGWEIPAVGRAAVAYVLVAEVTIAHAGCAVVSSCAELAWFDSRTYRSEHSENPW